MGDAVSLEEVRIKGIQPGSSLPVRNAPKTFAPDEEHKPPPFYTEFALSRLLRVADKLAAWIPDMSRYVEEYQGESFENVALGTTSVTVLPEYAPASELITEVLVTGPVTTAFNLILGDRDMSLSTDATGKCLLSPVSFKLGPTAQRTLVSVTSGAWFLHLSGHALTTRRNM